MSIEENQYDLERMTNNGWQNIGATIQYWRPKIQNRSAFYVMAYIVEKSFGLLKPYTKPKSMRDWARECGMSSKTFMNAIHYLEEIGAIRIGKTHSFGPKESFIYYPSYPKNVQIKLDNSPTGSDDYDIIYEKLTHDQKEHIENWCRNKYHASGNTKKFTYVDYLKAHPLVLQYLNGKITDAGSMKGKVDEIWLPYEIKIEEIL